MSPEEMRSLLIKWIQEEIESVKVLGDEDLFEYGASIGVINAYQRLLGELSRDPKIKIDQEFHETSG